MTPSEAKQIARQALEKGRLLLSPRGQIPATAARLLLSVLHGKVRIDARRQLRRQQWLEQGLTSRGGPLRIKRRPELAGLSPRAYAREYMRLRRHSSRRNKIKTL